MIGYVAELEDKIVGYMLYELQDASIAVLNFAVAAEHRRQRIGTQMVNRLKEKLSITRRTEITMDTRESNLPMHLFLRENGFRAVKVQRGFYDDTDESAYRFKFVLGTDDEVNRIYEAFEVGMGEG